MERAEAQLTAELGALYAAAGAPPLADVVRWGAACRPMIWFSVGSLADWLRPEKVALPSEGALVALVGFLSDRAHVPDRAAWWCDLRRTAWTQVHPASSLRPGVPGLPGR